MGCLHSRWAIYREFLSSEKAYIRDLTIIRDVFQTPFYTALKERRHLLEEQEIEIVFCNYEKILQVLLLLPSHADPHRVLHDNQGAHR